MLKSLARLKSDLVGQSLVEMAIAAPLLMLMFLGVFEVGWALRGYMVLANGNREAARYAVKNTVLDFSEKNPDTVGYNTVLSHTTDSVARQLPLEFLGPEPNSTAIMSHFVIDTGFPCVRYNGGGDPILPYEFDDVNCNCTDGNLADPNGPWFSRDDLVLHPDSPGYSYYGITYGISRTTRLNNGGYSAEAEELRVRNNQLNCTILKTGDAGEISVNNLLSIEMFYDQPQLLGAPLVSNRLTDPIPFYTHTRMRLVVGRDTEQVDTVGPVCSLFPITFAKQIFPSGQEDDPVLNTVLTLNESSGGDDDFNWVVWNQAESGNVDYLFEAMLNQRLAINDFVENGDPGDTVLSQGDSLKTFTASANEARIDDLVGGLVNQTIQVPVHDGTGKLDHVAKIGVTSVPDSTGIDRQLVATFLGYVDEACEE